MCLAALICRQRIRCIDSGRQMWTCSASQHTSRHATSPRVWTQAKLDVLRIPLRPTDAELAPLLGPRDTLPEGTLLSINFRKQPDGQKHSRSSC